MLSKSRIAIGINEDELAPVVLDFDAQPHLVAFADTECGKTGLLRNIAAGVMENATPTEAKIILVDFRRSLLGAIDRRLPRRLRHRTPVVCRADDGARRSAEGTPATQRHHPAAAQGPVLVVGAGSVRA